DKDKLSDFYKDRIKEVLISFIENTNKNNVKISAIADESIKLRDFTCIGLEQYGNAPVQTVFDDCGSLLDWYYFENDRMTRAKQKANDLLKFLMNTSERISKKLALQKNELLQCADREHFRVCGDILNANLYKLEKGMSSTTLDNFYDNTKIEIKLDPRLTPVKNAQKYYTEYRKAQTAEKMLTELIKKGEQELLYIESVFDCASRISGESEIVEIREELISEGYIRHNVKKNKMLKPLPTIKYVSSDGFTILCGRNNKQNDKLTLKTAKGNDIWLHTKDIPGSHVIIVTEGADVPEETLYQAAIISANNSKGRNSSRVAVDYTNVKYVKKPSGAKPGMVIFSQNKTMFVTPDFDLEAKLKV
ncbi:MAG: NFACT family protein, partial [Oscillospiraceae bacterium]